MLNAKTIGAMLNHREMMEMMEGMMETIPDTPSNHPILRRMQDVIHSLPGLMRRTAQLKLEAVGGFTPEELELIKNNGRIHAVKSLRARSELDLRDCMDLIRDEEDRIAIERLQRLA